MKTPSRGNRSVEIMLILLSMFLMFACVMNWPRARTIRRLVAKSRTVNREPNSITRGVYHEGLDGIAYLGGCQIPAHLKHRFVGLDGKYLQVESSALESEEWAIGPIVMHEIYDIQQLPLLPVAVDVSVRRTSDDEQRVDIIASFRNTGTEPAMINSDYVQFTLLQPRQAGAAVNLVNGTNAMHFQNYCDGFKYELRGADGQRRASRRDSSMGSKVLLQPQESIPYFWRATVAKPGRYELTVNYSHYVPELREYLPIRAWKVVDVPMPIDRSAPQPLTIRGTVSTELTTFYSQGEWERRHRIKGRLINATGQPRHVFAKGAAENGLCLPGEVLLYGRRGESVAGSVDWSVPDGPATRREIGPDGVPFQFFVWQKVNSPESPLDRIEFWMITDAGLEKITVVKDVPFENFLEPAWSPTVAGVRCRIRPLKERYSLDEEIEIGFEVESDRQSSDKLHPHFELTYDGTTVPLFDSTGWNFPFRTGLRLSDAVQVTPGRHKLRVTVQGTPGSNAYKRPEPRAFDGTLVSNELEIEVIAKKGP